MKTLLACTLALLIATLATPALAAKTVANGGIIDFDSDLSIGGCYASNNTNVPLPITITARASGNGRRIGQRVVVLAPYAEDGLTVPEDAGLWSCHFSTAPAIPVAAYMGALYYWTAQSGPQTVNDR